jgi:hypothetical protein
MGTWSDIVQKAMDPLWVVNGDGETRRRRFCEVFNFRVISPFYKARLHGNLACENNSKSILSFDLGSGTLLSRRGIAAV